MKLRFCIQDPTYVETTYLYEAIIAAAADAAAWRGIYAFASRDGVDHLIEDPVVHKIMQLGAEIDLLVGLDAVTNRQALERTQELARRNRGFHPKVFWNWTQRLFHPKISDFSYKDGRRTLIVGSGNLTPGGLMNNFEGYTIISADEAEDLDVSALDEFLDRHAGVIRIILPKPRGTGTHPAVLRSAPAAAFDRILIAQVPKAGGRWAQVHFNADIVRSYFRVTNLETQRVYLTRVGADGSRAEIEVRPCVYSQTNKNHKIEIGAARGWGYPNDTPPVLIFRERRLRTFDYTLLMPGETGYRSLFDATRKLPSVGRGVPRIIMDMNTLKAYWPNCPLLDSQGADEQEF